MIQIVFLQSSSRTFPVSVLNKMNCCSFCFYVDSVLLTANVIWHCFLDNIFSYNLGWKDNHVLPFKDYHFFTLQVIRHCINHNHVDLITGICVSVFILPPSFPWSGRQINLILRLSYSRTMEIKSIMCQTCPCILLDLC